MKTVWILNFVLTVGFPWLAFLHRNSRYIKATKCKFWLHWWLYNSVFVQAPFSLTVSQKCSLQKETSKSSSWLPCVILLPWTLCIDCRNQLNKHNLWNVLNHSQCLQEAMHHCSEVGNLSTFESRMITMKSFKSVVSKCSLYHIQSHSNKICLFYDHPIVNNQFNVRAYYELGIQRIMQNAKKMFKNRHDQHDEKPVGLINQHVKLINTRLV